MILRLLVTPPSSLSSLRRLMSNHRPILRRTLPRKRLHPTGAYCFPLLYRVSYIYDMNPVISVGREKEKEGGKEQVHEGQRNGKGQKVMAVVVALPVTGPVGVVGVVRTVVLRASLYRTTCDGTALTCNVSFLTVIAPEVDEPPSVNSTASATSETATSNGYVLLSFALSCVLYI